MHRPRHFSFRKSILLSLALLVAAAPLAAAPAQKADAWVRVEPPGVGFTVLMPEKPTEEVERVAAVGNTYAMRSYTAADAGGVVYFVAAQDLPSLTAAAAPPERVEKFIDGFKEGFVESLKASPGVSFDLKYERDLDLGGNFGRQYLISVGETRGLVRAYTSAGPRIHLLMVLGGKESDANVARFLGSFKVDDAPPPPKPTPDSRKPTPTPTAEPTIVADPVLFPRDSRPIPYGDPKPRAEHESSGGVGTVEYLFPLK